MSKYPINTEAIPTDDDDNIRTFAGEAVDIAMLIVQMMVNYNSSKIYENDLSHPPLKQALAFLGHYADWRKIEMPDAYKQYMREREE